MTHTIEETVSGQRADVDICGPIVRIYWHHRGTETMLTTSYHRKLDNGQFRQVTR